MNTPITIRHGVALALTTLVACVAASSIPVRATEFGSAVPISCPLIVDDQLAIDPLEEIDLFLLTGLPGRFVVIDIDAAEIGSPLDPILGVFDVTGTLIVSSDDDPAPGEPPTFDPYLEVVMPAEGQLFIAVSAYPDFDFDGIGGLSSGPYTLIVSCRECLGDAQCADGDPCVTDTCWDGECRHRFLDDDADGVCDLVDTCPAAFNPGQGTVVFAEPVRVGSYCADAPGFPCIEDLECESGSCVKAAFLWDTPVAYRYSSGSFDSSAAIGTLWADNASGTDSGTSYVHTEDPAPGSGYWFLFRPDCTTGSWETQLGAEPERDSTLPTVVPPEFATEIAVAEAGEIWGGGVVGTPVATYDGGNISSYLVPFALDSGVFPSDAEIFGAVESARADWGLWTESFYNQVEATLGRIGTVQVAASTGDYPVFAVYEGIHPYYLHATAANERAAERLGSLPLFQRYVFRSPHEEYFEVVTDLGSTLLHAHTLIPEDQLVPLELPSPPAAAVARAWDEGSAPSPVVDGSNFISLPENVPIIDWSCWCVPTTISMMVGYWDHLGPQGTIPGYGRAIDFWRERTCRNNIPNFMDEMINYTNEPACPMGCSWRPETVEQILNTSNGYAFSWTEVDGNAGNDWAWSSLTAEIDAGRPALWAVGPQRPHAMTAYGYRVSGGQKFVVVYNTWGTTRRQQSMQYNYDQWSGAKIGYSKVQGLIPGGAETSHAFLLSPRGGEVVFGNTDIAWRTTSSAITRTSLYFSSDAGNIWSLIAADLPTTSGVNHRAWNAVTQTTQGRVRIEARTASGKLIAGDGSFKNFVVAGAPDLVPQPNAQGNFCQFGPLGQLRAIVRNQGTMSAGASTVQVVFDSGQTVTSPVPALAAGSNTAVDFDIPAACPNPDCGFTITVDSTHVVDEAIESNNTASGTCTG